MTASAPRKSKKEFDPNKGYEELANSLIQIMEKGTNPFRRTWSSEQQHTNFVTGDAYQNGNLICLEIARICRGFTSPYWMGFSQARSFGLKIKKGSKGSIILRPIAIKKELLDTNGKPVLDINGNKEFTAFTLFTPCRVFNLDCFEKSEKLNKRLAELTKEVAVNHSPVSAKEAKAIKQLQNYMDTQNIDFQQTGNSAFYDPIFDSVTVPTQNRFETNSLFVSVVSHELGHSTGHKKRLNRKGITDNSAVFGSDLYATEELIADTCSFLCCNEFQIDSNDDIHASYLAGWIKVLKKEPKHLLTVIGQAVKAKNLIMGS